MDPKINKTENPHMAHNIRRRPKKPCEILYAVLCSFLVNAACSGDVLTYHNDNARTGLNDTETILKPANLDASTFGLLHVDSVDGKVDAQPLYVSNLQIPNTGSRNILYVETEHDSAYAFDADTGALYWQVTLLGTNETPSDSRNCDQVTPEIGITATPVIDRAIGQNGAIFMVAMSKDSSGGYHHRLHALDLATGAEILAGPVEIHAQYPGSGPDSSNGYVQFDPAQYKERCALLLLGGELYLSWASHCDIAPYTSWIMAYSEAALQQTAVLNLDPNGSPNSTFLTDGSGSAFWNSGAGPAADPEGNIYHLTGNGPFDTTFNSGGFPINGDYGDTFLKLSTSSGLSVADYFTPSNQQSYANGDVDLGSGGAMVLPDILDDSGTVHHLAVGAGKDGNLYVVNRDSMGKFNSQNDSQIYQKLPGALSGGEWATSAYFDGNVYYGPVGNHLLAFQFVNGKLTAAPVSQSPNTFGYPGCTPSVSANGVTDGILWGAENGSVAVLHAYDATNLDDELYNSDTAPNGADHFGTGNKFITPTIANGKVYVATTDGVGVFGLRSPTPSFTYGFNSTGLVLNGTASLQGAALRLTDGRNNEAASAFWSSPLNIQRFTADFTFQLQNPRADGITFVIQAEGSNALGKPGGGLGYRGIQKSVAVKWDLYNNAGEGNDSTGLYIDGAPPTIPSVNLTPSGINLHDGHVFQVHIDYTGAALWVTTTDANNPAVTEVHEYAVDIPSIVGSSSAYVGFTGGTGGLAATQEILTWTFSPGSDLVALSAGYLSPGNIYQLTPACAPGSCLDVNGGSAQNGAKVQIWHETGGTNQQWKALYDGNGVWEFEPQNATAERLDVFALGIAPGTKVEQWVANGGSNQKWLLYEAGSGALSLEPQNAIRLRLDVRGASSADGTQVQIYPANGSRAERWFFTPQH